MARLVRPSPSRPGPEARSCSRDARLSDPHRARPRSSCEHDLGGAANEAAEDWLMGILPVIGGQLGQPAVMCGGVASAGKSKIMLAECSTERPTTYLLAHISRA